MVEEIINSQKKTLGISDFLNNAKIYTENAFPDFNIGEAFTQSIKGSANHNFIFSSVSRIFGQEIKVAIELMVSVLIIVIIHSIFKAITENLGSSSSGKVVYFIQYLIIVTVVINTFVNILDLTQNAINDMTDFMKLFVPLMTTLMLTTGCITTTSIIQPILIFVIQFISNFINTFLIPLLLVSMTLGIISQVSDKVQIDKLSKFLKSSIVWILGIILTIFTCTLSLEGTLSSSVDGFTSKTAKAAVANFIPVVGKIMGDTVETVIGCGNILKNSVGVIGIIIVLGIVLIPLIKIVALWLSFQLTSALCEAVADAKIVKLISQIADSYKILLAILFSVSVMFIVGITLVLKITNSSLMYR